MVLLLVNAGRCFSFFSLFLFVFDLYVLLRTKLLLLLLLLFAKLTSAKLTLPSLVDDLSFTPPAVDFVRVCSHSSSA